MSGPGTIYMPLILTAREAESGGWLDAGILGCSILCHSVVCINFDINTVTSGSDDLLGCLKRDEPVQVRKLDYFKDNAMITANDKGMTERSVAN